MVDDGVSWGEEGCCRAGGWYVDGAVLVATIGDAPPMGEATGETLVGCRECGGW